MLDQEFEKMLSQLSDMEMFDPCDKLSKFIQQTVGADDNDLDEYDLELGSDTESQIYQKFMKRFGEQNSLL